MLLEFKTYTRDHYDNQLRIMYHLILHFHLLLKIIDIRAAFAIQCSASVTISLAGQVI